MLGCVAGSRAETTNHKVDSLKRLLQSHQPIDKAEVLWNIAYELFDVDNPQALFYAERAYQEVWAKGDSLQIVKIGTTYGQLLRRVGELNRSMTISSSLLQIAKRHDFRKYRKMLLNSLGIIATSKSEFDRALEYHYESLELRQEEADTMGIIVALQNICLVYYRMEDYELAYNYLIEASRFSQSREDSLITSQMHYLLGNIYTELGSYDSAKVSFQNAIKFGKNGGPIYQCLAYTCFKFGEIDSAESHAIKAVTLASKQLDRWALSFSYLTLSKVDLSKKNMRSAFRFLKKADSVSRGYGYTDVDLRVLYHRANLMAAIGQWNQATKFFKSYNHKSDSIYDGQKDARVRAVQLAFHQKENAEKLKAQASVLLIQKKSLDQQRFFLLVISVILLIALILAVELYRANRKVYGINKLLDERVVERTAELVLQRDELIHNREEQKVYRRRIYGELREQITSLAGIVHLGTIDKGSDHHVYFKQASVTLSRMDEAAKKLISKTQ